ncbi:MAG: DEAD/DEAH box helicase [Anaerolinea sp.]|nr:DEAD/DEAH box helicase [Anaerolinea sp.]
MVHNPLEAGQHLLKQYQAKLQFTLENNNLTAESIERILDSIQLDSGIYLSLNPIYEHSGEPFANFVRQQQLPETLVTLFPKLAESGLYTHQKRGILSILQGQHTIISTGTGSGKTETFLVPIIAHCLQSGGHGVKAIIVYPMNALAGDQIERIAAYTQGTDITFGLYTGATPESSSEAPGREHQNQLISRDEIRANPPDILITNYVMLDRLLTREKDHRIFVESGSSLRYLILDELHTYTGSKATHLKYLLARLRYYFAHKITYIGTSATLVSNAAGKARLDKFVQDLFDISFEAYDFIEAVKAPEEPVIPSQPLPVLTDDDLVRIDFSTDENAAVSIGLLTGSRVDTFDFYVPSEKYHQTPVYQSLFTNDYVAAIRHALEQNSQSYSDLVGYVSRVIPAGQFQMITPERLLSSYLGAITFVNEKAGERGKPLLDYRLHVFVRNLIGILRMCPVCQRYFSGDTGHCPHDGHTVFAVYRHDVSLCVGKFNKQRLSPIIEAESTDFENVHYVLIGRATNDLNDRFELRGNLSFDGKFQISSDGEYCLAHLDAANPEQLENDLIHVGDEKRDYLYMIHLVKTILQIFGKSLGFVDNRELASRYSTIIRDEFASEFLYEFLCLHYPHERKLAIDRTLAYLQKCAGEIQGSNLEQAIFSEIPIWFYRMISTPERLGGIVGLFKWRDDIFDGHNLPDLHRALVDIFIRERAILTGFTDDGSDTHFIRFQKYRATRRRGIFLEDGASIVPDYDGISLGERSSEYADFVETWSSHAIRQAIDELVTQDVIVCETTPDGKAIYYLNWQYLCFNLPPSSYGEGDDGYEQLKRSLLFTAEVHSSDVKTTERELIEAEFRRGDLHFIAATPTLEMGIDIGGLESVVMFGTPPTPANYAQRAGRAGRGKRRDALIVTFCSATNPYDTYAFHNAQEIINGRVTPPAFNPTNPEILKKHINAFVLRHHLRNRDTLRQFASKADQAYREQILQMQVLFGNWFDHTAYLSEFKLMLEHIFQDTAGKRGSLAHYCYEAGIFPDYSFQRDQVIAIDVHDNGLSH